MPLTGTLPLGAAGSARWPAVADLLLRGLVHRLNNCAHGVLAIAHELEYGSASLAAPLRQEGERLEETIRLLRLLTSSRAPRPEGLDAADLLHDVAAIYVQRAGGRIPSCTVDVDEDAPPLRADPARAVRTMLLACELMAGDALCLHLAARKDDGCLTIRVRGAGELDENDEWLAELHALASQDDGDVRAIRADALEVRYPALGA